MEIHPGIAQDTWWARGGMEVALYVMWGSMVGETAEAAGRQSNGRT